MPNLDDALSSFRGKVSEFRGRATERFELKRKKYLLKRRYKKNKDVLSRKWSERYKPYLDYVFNEFLWITLANGLVLNIPFNHFLDFGLTPYSVVAFGCVWYALFVMVPDLVRQ